MNNVGINTDNRTGLRVSAYCRVGSNSIGIHSIRQSNSGRYSAADRIRSLFGGILDKSLRRNKTSTF